MIDVLRSLPDGGDDPVWMVNLMRYRDHADYADGPSTELTGREADDMYAPLDTLAEIGAEVVQFDRDAATSAGSIGHMTAHQTHAASVAIPQGMAIYGWFDVEGTVIGNGRRWEQALFNRSPSRAAFMATATGPIRLGTQQAHREPAMADACTLIVRPLIDTMPASLEGHV